MNIETNRLILREISWDDLEDIHRLNSLPEVSEFNITGIPKDIEETKESIRPYIEGQTIIPRPFYNWKIESKDKMEFIGLANIKFSLDRLRLGEISFKLFPDHWGKGYATEVLKKLITTGFDYFKLHKIEAGTIIENSKSIRVLEKSGMIREGIRRKIVPIRGEWKDGYLYAIVEDDIRDY
ncbi:MAG TPA: GNAT family N-acetyltransferase [Bacteroidales bacterium]|nr:GNAT family N-acetyltransferase [Bacteroidales bacterium]